MSWLNINFYMVRTWFFMGCFWWSVYRWVVFQDHEKTALIQSVEAPFPSFSWYCPSVFEGWYHVKNWAASVFNQGDYSHNITVVTLLVANSSSYWKNHQPYSGSDWLYIPIISSVLHLPLYAKYLRVSLWYPHSPQNKSPHVFQLRHYGNFSHSYGSYRWPIELVDLPIIMMVIFLSSVSWPEGLSMASMVAIFIFSILQCQSILETIDDYY